MCTGSSINEDISKLVEDLEFAFCGLQGCGSNGVSTENVADLEERSQTLDHLIGNVSHNCSNVDLSTWSFYEMLMTILRCHDL